MRRDGTSDVEGRYRIEGLPRDQLSGSFVMEAKAGGFAPVSLTSIPYADPEGRIIQDLFLTRGARIEGLVLDAETGARLAGARIVLWTHNMVAPITKPDGSMLRNPDATRAFHDDHARSDGTFVIEHVPSWGVHPVGHTTFAPRERLLGAIAAIVPGYAPSVASINLPSEGAVVKSDPSLQAGSARPWTRHRR